MKLKIEVPIDKEKFKLKRQKAMPSEMVLDALISGFEQLHKDGVDVGPKMRKLLKKLKDGKSTS